MPIRTPSSTPSTTWRRRVLYVTVIAALPYLGLTQAHADCVASIPEASNNPDFGNAGYSSSTTPSVKCSSATSANALVSGSGNLTITDNTTFVDRTQQGQTTTKPGGDTLLQFEGQGRTLIVNSGALLGNFRNTTNGNRTAVWMGHAAVSGNMASAYAFNADTFTPSTTTTVTYNSGAATTTLNLASTPDTSWVGQKLVIGRFDSARGYYSPATAYTITAVDTTNKTVTISGQLPTNFADATGVSTALPIRYAVIDNYGAYATMTTPVNSGVSLNNVIQNKGTITTGISLGEINTTATGAAASPYNATIKGIMMDGIGTHGIDNKSGGTISASHAGIGNAYAIEANDRARLDIYNAGTILAERTVSLSLYSVGTSGTPTATASGIGYAATAIGNVNALNVQNEVLQINVLNDGVIRSKGDYSGTLYSLGLANNITNNGLIEHVSTASTDTAPDYSKGFAIGVSGRNFNSISDIRTLSLTNNGTGILRGDILAVNSSALRWYLLSTVGTTTSGSSNLAQGLNDRINVSGGQANSTISNAGTMTGNVWLSNGAHTLTNTGTLRGNVDVEQRDTGSGTASGSVVVLDSGSGAASNNTLQGSQYVFRGAKTFNFSNSSRFTGNIGITNASSSFSGSYTPPGGGAAQTVSGTVNSNNTVQNTGTFDGNISINDVAGAQNTITLTGDGFGRTDTNAVNSASGNISAINGTGTNVLNLSGTGTLRGNVSKFTTLNVSDASANWTLDTGKSFEFSNVARVDAGVLNVLGNLRANTELGSAATLKGSGTITGNLNSGGTVDLASTTLNVTGNVTLQSGSSLRTTIIPGANGKLLAGGSASVSSAATVVPTVNGVSIKTGDQFTVVTANAGVSGVPTVANSGLIKWAANVVGANNLVLTATVTDTASLPGTFSSVLNALLSFNNPLGVQVLNQMTEADVRKSVEQLRPEINGAALQAAISMTDKVLGLVSARLNEIYWTESGGRTGIATGEQPNGAGVWLQGFGFKGEQLRRNNVDGYSLGSYGVVLGADKLVSDNMRVGAALSYGRSGVDDQGVNSGNKFNMDSYQLSLYGSRLMTGWYLDTMLGIGHHEYDSTRLVLGNVVNGQHAAWQYTAKVEAGWPVAVGTVTLTPVAGLTYSRLNQDGYTETGVGALTISGDNTSSVRSGLGSKLMLPLQTGALDSALVLHAIWGHEFLNTRQDAIARFVAGGNAFTTTGVNPARDSLNFGGSLVFLRNQKEMRQQLLLNYDAEVRERYLGHTVKLQARLEF